MDLRHQRRLLTQLPRPAYDRRSFLRRAAGVAGGVAAGGLLVDLGGCAAPIPLGEQPAAPGQAYLGLFRRELWTDPVEAAQAAFLQQDLSWLGPGDSVFLKVASNSGQPHPAVTSPSSVAGVVRGLFEAGAGRVIVGDQAGVQQVRLVEGDRRFSSTQRIFEQNGLDAAAGEGAELHFFDDRGFEDGYVDATLPEGSFWNKPMRIPAVTREVDHIVYLPRLSSHLLAGYTHGTKMAIGWLRDDSRRYLHHEASTFYEKYVDVSYVEEIRSRLRLTFTFVEALLLHQGPDFGTIATADPYIAVSSSSLAVHDALSVAVMTLFDRSTPADIEGLAYGPWADAANYAFLNVVVEQDTGIPWGPDEGSYSPFTPHSYQHGLGADRALTRSFNLEGGRPPSIPVRFDGEAPGDDLRLHLAAYSGGLLDMSALG